MHSWCRKCVSLRNVFRPGVGYGGGRQTGTLLELLAEVWWMDRGYITSRASAARAPYDLILDDGTRLLRCEVKVKSQRSTAKLGVQCDVLTTVDPLRKIEVFWAPGMEPAAKETING